jgi:hypothetical protein
LRFLLVRSRGNILDEAVAPRDGGGHADPQPQVPAAHRPESPPQFLFFWCSCLLLPFHGLFGHSAAGGDQQLGYAHAVVKRLPRAQSREVNPPYRALVPVPERGPEHTSDGELPPHSPQFLLRGLEQLQTQGGR